MTKAVSLRSGMIGNYHVPFCRAAERATSLLTLIVNAGIVISQLGAAVIDPESSVLTCQLGGQMSLFPIGSY